MRRFAYSQLCGLVLAALLLGACQPAISPTGASSAGALATGTAAGPPTLVAQPLPGWIQIYFTNPDAPGAASYRGGPDEALVAAIDEARLSVDVAIYSLNLWSVRDALLRAYRRGVAVRMVTESDNMDSPEIQSLIQVGIPVLGDRRQGLMHHKFVIIDRSQVWTGSMNYTAGSAYRDDNNLVCIRSTAVAEDYQREFDEMFIEDRFGPDSRPDTPRPRLTLDGTAVEVYFSPDDGAAARIVQLIRASQRSIHFLAFSFTSDEIGEAIRQQMVFTNVYGVMDNGQAMSNTGSEYEVFLAVGLDVHLDGNSGLMHHKVIILDQRIVIFGSYNFTNSAERNNDENLVIIDNAAVAATFLSEFWRVYRQAAP
jgi:phosphatidylserine/phosphatidylglycerophosphate/cardiolipin synthase-like enzyme